MSQWYAVRTATRRERAAAKALAEQGVTLFLPMATRWGQPTCYHERAAVTSPLMPGYLFVLIELEQMRQVLEVDGVHAFVTYMDDEGVLRPFPIPLAAVLEIQIDERSGTYDATRYIKPRYRPKKGDRVKVMAGPWLSFIGKVLATPRGERVHLMIEGPFGRGLTLDAAHLSAA